MTTKEIVTEYLSLALLDRSENTVRSARSAFDRLVRAAPRWPIDRDTMVKWLHKRRTEVANSMVELDRAQYQRFFRWARDMGYLDNNPFAGIPHLPVQRVFRNVIPMEHFRKMQEVARKSTLPIAYLITYAWYSGHRLIDLCLTSWSDVSEDFTVVTMRPQKTKRFGTYVSLPIPEELQEYFKAMAAGSNRIGYVAPILAALYKRNGGQLNRELRYVTRDAGVPPYTWHEFRHTRATRMGAAGISDIDAATVLGMRSLATYQRYKQVSTEAKRRALEA